MSRVNSGRAGCGVPEAKYGVGVRFVRGLSEGIGIIGMVHVGNLHGGIGSGYDAVIFLGAFLEVVEAEDFMAVEDGAVLLPEVSGEEKGGAGDAVYGLEADAVGEERGPQGGGRGGFSSRSPGRGGKPDGRPDQEKGKGGIDFLEGVEPSVRNEDVVLDVGEQGGIGGGPGLFGGFPLADVLGDVLELVVVVLLEIADEG